MSDHAFVWLCMLGALAGLLVAVMAVLMLGARLA